MHYGCDSVMSFEYEFGWRCLSTVGLGYLRRDEILRPNAELKPPKHAWLIASLIDY
jgi:hypothetical protein